MRLAGPQRAAFVADATEAIGKLGPDAYGPDAYGPGAVHRTVALVWRRHFHPPEIAAT